jgi:hypothetical protein
MIPFYATANVKSRWMKSWNKEYANSEIDTPLLPYVVTVPLYGKKDPKDTFGLKKRRGSSSSSLASKQAKGVNQTNNQTQRQQLLPHD